MASHRDTLPPQNKAKLRAFALHKKWMTIQLDITHTTCIKAGEYTEKYAELATSPPQALPLVHMQEILEHCKKLKIFFKKILILLISFILEEELQDTCLRALVDLQIDNTSTGQLGCTNATI